MTPSSGPTNVIEWFAALREMLAYIYWFIKGYEKDTDEERHRVRSATILNTGASVPMELGDTTPPICGCVHLPGSSLNPILLGFLWRLFHVSMINY